MHEFVYMIKVSFNTITTQLFDGPVNQEQWNFLG